MRLAVRPRGMALASVALTVPLWVACDAGSPSGAAVMPAHAPTALCQKILGVSTTLRSLIRADRSLVKSNDADKTAKTGIKEADTSLNKACPGVAS